MARKKFAPRDTFPLASHPDLVQVRKQLESLARNSIRLRVTAVEDEDTLPIGSSKLGGRPDLPAGTEWPWYQQEVAYPTPRYESLDTTEYVPFGGKISLPFIAQFRMEDLFPYDVDQVLPKEGMLYFFYSDASYANAKDSRYEHSGRVRIMYSSEAASSALERQEFPSNLAVYSTYRFKYKPCTVAFTRERLLPRREVGVLESADILNPEEWDLWQDLTYEARSGSISQMLGYPDLGSHPVGLRYDLFPEIKWNYDKMTPEESMEHSLDLRLMLQLDSDALDAMGWNNRTFFIFMRNQDLLKKDFSRVWTDTD